MNFLLEQDYLYEMLPISRGANVLLRKIFAYDSSERITLSALRKEIVALDTFFMTNDELARAGQVVRDAAAYCGVHVQPIKSLDHEGGPPAENKAVVGATQRTPSGPPAPHRDDLSAASSADITESSGPSSSVVGSEGPITPASYPVDDEDPLHKLESQLEGLDLTEMITEEKMPSAPRIVQVAQAFWS